MLKSTANVFTFSQTKEVVMRYPVENGRAVASRMLKLAWDASSVMGMGIFQDRGPKVSEEEIFKMAATATRVNADYICGRMMKLYFEFGEDFVEGSGSWRADYQSFCHKYPSFESLVEAAEISL